MLFCRGLLHSYSRGSWIATLCGLGYLFGPWCWVPVSVRESEVRDQRSKGRGPVRRIYSWLERNWRPALFLLLSVFVLLFWQFRQSEWHPGRRLFSSVNAVDFSWRNRVAAWEGALQIAAAHPWFGTGWNQPESLYENYLLPPKVIEGSAIEMNDYLMLAATLGIPALACFGIYLWCTLSQNHASSGQLFTFSKLDWLGVTCRAGAIVLLVGFWFDGGLFKLATTSTFWILLELGNVGSKAKG
jgi:O-antigen ligase